MKPITTNAGVEALRAAELGEELRFTKVVIGSGNIPDGVDKYTISDVIEQIDVRPIVGRYKGKSGNNAVIVFTITNKGRNDGFYFREIGVYAATDSTGEILFTYYNSGEQAEYIPAAGPIAVNRTLHINNAIAQTEKVTVLIDFSQEAPLYQVEEAKAMAQEALDKATEASDREITCPDGGCPALQALKTQIERLERGLYDKVDSNAFSVDFWTITGKTMSAGVWNEAAGRLEC